MPSVPPRPDPPIIEEVTHHTIHLQWEDTLERIVRKQRRGKSREILVILEGCEEYEGKFQPHYTGYGTSYTANKLESERVYIFRIQFKNEVGVSEWSAEIKAKTSKKPPTSDDLHRAIKRGAFDLFEKTLESGTVQVDALDQFDETALMDAAKRGLCQFVEKLIEYGADVNFLSKSGKTALMVSSYHGHVDVVKILREAGASYETHDNAGLFPIHYAVDGRKVQLMECLLDDGCEVDKREVSEQKWTPLHRSALFGDLDLARLLIRHHASIDAQDADGKTPLVIAIINNHRDLVELLLEKGADVHLPTAAGITALEIGRQSDRINIKNIFIHLTVK